jgi:aspartate carbamoyltransferase regulatory subunit
MEATEKVTDRRGRVRVVSKAPYTLECKLCGRRWRPKINASGRIERWGMMCPNPTCVFHGERRRRKRQQ